MKDKYRIVANFKNLETHSESKRVMGGLEAESEADALVKLEAYIKDKSENDYYQIGLNLASMNHPMEVRVVDGAVLVEYYKKTWDQTSPYSCEALYTLELVKPSDLVGKLH